MIFEKCCDPKTDMLPNKTYPKMITQVAFIPSGHQSQIHTIIVLQN